MPKLLSTVSSAKTVDEFLSFEHLEKALATRALFNIDSTHRLLRDSQAPSKTKQNELFALENQKMARTHLIYTMFKMTKNRINSYKFNDGNVKVPLELILKVFATKHLLKDP